MRNKEIQRQLAWRIIDIRRMQNMTQEDLADASGLTVVAISRLERARRSPRLETLARLATGLGVPLPDLFKFKAEPAAFLNMRHDVRALADTLRGQPMAKVKLVSKIARVVLEA